MAGNKGDYCLTAYGTSFFLVFLVLKLKCQHYSLMLPVDPSGYVQIVNAPMMWLTLQVLEHKSFVIPPSKKYVCILTWLQDSKH